MAKPKINSTTQAFTEIEDIIEDVVFFKGRSACSVLDVSSVNFFLLSQDEQNARIYGYMSFLNSLSFAIQIMILSKRVDMSAYIKLIEQKIATSPNQKIAEHLTYYNEFIQQLVKGGQLLDKKIYIVVPFTPLELGPLPPNTKHTDYPTQVKTALSQKRSTVIGQVERMGLTSRVLQGEELVELFYEVFNQEMVNIDFDSKDVKNVIL